MEDTIVLNERMRRRNNKYQAEENHYQARIDPERLPEEIRNVPMVAVIDSLRELFTLLIRRTTEGLNPTDRIRFLHPSKWPRQTNINEHDVRFGYFCGKNFVNNNEGFPI